MLFDFSNENFYDNHTHVLDMDKPVITVDQFLKSYNHGTMSARDENGAKFPSQKHLASLRELPMVLQLVHFMAERFGCEETVEAVWKPGTRQAAVLRKASVNMCRVSMMRNIS